MSLFYTQLLSINTLTKYLTKTDTTFRKDKTCFDLVSTLAVLPHRLYQSRALEK